MSIMNVVHPQDIGEALDNPGMGWVFHYYDNSIEHYGSRLAPTDTLDDFPGLTVVYLRLAWSYIEPQEGRFNWSVVDTPAQRWIAKGKKVAFRFTASETGMRFATPEWVKDAGAKGYEYTYRHRPSEPRWEPDFDDPVFLAKFDQFLAAAAARYDGDPDVAFIDIGSIGAWGEGHTWPTTRRSYPPATFQRHIDLHCKHFKKTLLVVNDDFVHRGATESSRKCPSPEGTAIIDYARERGLTLRDDSILVRGGEEAYFSAQLAQPFWPHVPVVLESEHFGPSRDKGFWGDGSLYLQAVEDYHASYISIHWWPREFLNENRELIDKINLRLGYRLQLVEMTWPRRTSLAQNDLMVRSVWRNAGVAPALPGGFPAFTLKDAEGGIVAVLVDDAFDVRRLPVGPPGQAETMVQERRFQLPLQLRPGRYFMYVSVGSRTGKPHMQLPYTHHDGLGRYCVGTLTVEP